MDKTRKVLELEKRLGENLEDYLKREYIENRRPMYKIAEELGVRSSYVNKLLKGYGIFGMDSATVCSWLGEYGIPRKSKSDVSHKELKPTTKEELTKMYIEGRKPAKKIAKMAGVSTETVLNWLRGYKIPIRRPAKA